MGKEEGRKGSVGVLGYRSVGERENWSGEEGRKGSLIGESAVEEFL